MLRHHILQFLVIATAIGISADVNGAAVETLGLLPPSGEQTQPVTLQDLKEYIQPILYHKLLRTPGDSVVIQQAKVVVAEYLADSLIESVKSIPAPPEKPQRPALKQATNGTNNNNGGGISAGSQIIQAVTGISGNRTRPSSQHVIMQVDNILQNVNGANITGIVDQALLIRAPAPVRQLVNGIMNLVLCNPLNRIWNLCNGGGNIFVGGANGRR